MKKLGGFLSLKLPPAEQLAATPAETQIRDTTRDTGQDAGQDAPVELDEELFSAHGVQLGGENEALRNLLLDAHAKINELDTIKNAVGKLVDPVGKALRAIEAERAEKAALQTVLNNSRTAYGKLRNEMTEAERRLNAAERDGKTLRQELTATENQLKIALTTKAEIATDVAARRAQVVDLEARLAQQTTEGNAAREQARRLDERLTAADKRIAALESELQAARQRLLTADDEKRAQQTMLEKASAETARLSRKLAETEAGLNAAQGRLRQVEANFAEVSNERSRLAHTLDEIQERQEHELSTQRMRFDALQARSTSTDRLLEEARAHLHARGEEVQDADRRLSEVMVERDALQSRIAELEADRITRESAFREMDQARLTLMDRAGSLARAYTNKEAALTRAEETVAALNERVTSLEEALTAERDMAAESIEDLRAALRREQMERSVVEGALETARKDYSRAMREVMALQRQQQAQEPAPQPRAANAA